MSLALYLPRTPQQTALLAEFTRAAGCLDRDDRPDHLTASAVVVDVSRTHVLLVLHRKVGLWLQPGGHVDATDSSLAAAALREAVEETGVAELRLVSDAPVHLDRHPAPCGARDHLDVRYLVEAPDGAAVTVSEESLDVKWFALADVPALLQEMVDAALAV